MGEVVTSHEGLTVTITPLESAFFAGEVFTALVTFKNCAAGAARLPSVHSLHSLSHAQQHAQQQRTTTWGQSQRAPQRKRPPSASQFGLADYTSHHLGSDEIPPSPFFRSRDSGAFSTLPPEHRDDNEAARDATVGVLAGGALPTPQSASFAHHQHHYRSASSANSPVASTSKLPTRKGLIGKPIAPWHDRKSSAYGLYPGGPRRPGLHGHGRAHSVAFSNSSPDLLESQINSRANPFRGHGSSKLAESAKQRSSIAHSRSSSIQPAIIEEGASPYQYSTNDRSRFPSAQSEALSSTFSLESEPSEPYDPSDSVSSLQRFYGTGQNDTMESVVRDNVDQWASQRTPTVPGAFSSPRSVSTPSVPDPRRSMLSRAPSYALSEPRSTSFMQPPGTINLLWSFAHLEGFFEVDTALVKPAEFMEVKRALIGAFGTGVGGGTLQKKKSSGWRDWLWGADPAEEDATAAASLEERRQLTMKDKTVPVWSNPPSILGVDVILEPGESKTYTFSARIPADMPPSFRGRSLKFTYQLVVGINRAQLGLGADTNQTISRTMRVPIRLYNNVAVTGARPFYDLTNPVIAQRDDATVVDSNARDPKKPAKVTRPDTERADFEQFATSLLDSVLLSSPEAFNNLSLSPQVRPTRLSTSAIMSPALRPEMRTRTTKLSLTEDSDEPEDCRAAVEIVSRNSQKASFDINKDGFMVARLTLVKTAYRLGETVNGSILLNSGEGRVLRVSIRLETHEQIETSISTKSAAQVRAATARLHSEHHEMTLDSARIGFALAIPSGATPDFATSGVKLQWSVRLSFLVIPPSPAGPAPSRTPSSGSLQNGNGPTAGNDVRSHGRSKSFAHGFQPAISLTLPDTPTAMSSGAAHLMPVTNDTRRTSLTPSAANPSADPHTSYRAVPDLGFVPVLFASAVPEPPPAPGPLQRSAHGHRRDMSLGAMPAQRPPAAPPSNVVLVPAKVDTVECSIPIKVYPGNTAFRPTVTIFDC